MAQLSTDEKRFIACFVENCHAELQPRYKNCISLYTYIDKTSESEAQQKVQLEHNDLDLADWLNLISTNIRSNTTQKHVERFLNRYGYLRNPEFLQNFMKVARWLSSPEADDFRKKVRNERKKLKTNTSNEQTKNPQKPHNEGVQNAFQRFSNLKHNRQSTPLKAAEENAIALVVQELRKLPPRVFIPKENFDPSFEREARFFAAFIVFQLKVKKDALIEGRNQ